MVDREVSEVVEAVSRVVGMKSLLLARLKLPTSLAGEEEEEEEEENELWWRISKAIIIVTRCKVRHCGK